MNAVMILVVPSLGVLRPEPFKNCYNCECRAGLYSAKRL